MIFTHSPNEIVNNLTNNRLVFLKGVRGVGKTTLLKEVKRLIGQKEKNAHCLYLDLEDPRFYPKATISTLDTFTRSWTDNSDKKLYLFADEIQRVSNWNQWANSFCKKGHCLLATSSGALQKSQDNSINIKVTNIFPLRYYQLSTDTSVDNVLFSKNFDKYLYSGGFPIALDPNAREDWPKLFLGNCLYSDVIVPFEIRDPEILTAISVYLLSKTANNVSANQLKPILCKSIDQARSFICYIERAGLVQLVSRIEDEKRERASAARRVYSCDTGLSVRLASNELSLRDLAETVVFWELVRHGFHVQVFRRKDLFGLCVLENEKPKTLVYVSYCEEDESNKPQLISAMKHFHCVDSLLLVKKNAAQKENTLVGQLVVCPLSIWLRSPFVPGIIRQLNSRGDVLEPMSVESKSEELVLPPHLL